MALAMSLHGASALAQEEPEPSIVFALTPRIGKSVIFTDAAGREIRGRLLNLHDEAALIQQGSTTTLVPYADVVKAERRGDKVWDSAVGVLGGFALLAAVGNGTPLPGLSFKETLGLVTDVTAIAFAIDLMYVGRTRLYIAPAASPANDSPRAFHPGTRAWTAGVRVGF